MKNKFSHSGFSAIIVTVIIVLVVVAGGILAWQKGWLPKIITSKFAPTPIVAPTPTPNETANWKIYRNEEYGYEVRYPVEWTGGEKLTITDYAFFSLSSLHGTGVFFGIRVYENPDGFTPEEWWEQKSRIGIVNWSYKGNFPISGINARVYQGEEEGGNYNYYLLPKDAKIYFIDTLLGEEEMHQILSTFKFLE